MFGRNTRCTLLFHWRGTGMHTGMPLSVFVDTHDHSDVDKDILLGFSRFTPWRNMRLSHRISRHFRSEWKSGGPGCSRWPRDLGPWFRSSNQFLLCFVSSPFSLNYKPFHPAECRTITGCFFFFFSLSTPFHPYLGDHEIFLSPCLLWDVTAGSIQWEIGCN